MMKKSVVFVTQLGPGYGIDVVGCVEDNCLNYRLIILKLIFSLLTGRWLSWEGQKSCKLFFFADVVCPKLLNFRREREVCEVTPFYLMVCFI